MTGFAQIRAAMITAGFMALPLAAPAVACSPAPFEVGTQARFGSCGISHFDEEYEAHVVSDVTDLGGGFVAQYVTTGNACYGQTSMVVVDCAAGRSAIFGPGPSEGPMQPLPASDPWKALETRVLAAAKSAQPMPLDDILARSQGRFINAAIVAVPARVGISNDRSAPQHRFDLGCGCGVFYPGSAGAGS